MQADALAVRMCQTAFDLSVPRHFRAALVRLAEEEHLLVLVFHHVIIDGASMGTVFDELDSSREVQRSTFARFLGLFDFRLLQQYRS